MRIATAMVSLYSNRNPNYDRGLDFQAYQWILSLSFTLKEHHRVSDKHIADAQTIMKKIITISKLHHLVIFITHPFYTTQKS